MPNFTTIMFLGPGIEFAPFINTRSPKFLLPIINEHLLDININWIRPVSSRIFIVVLKDYIKILPPSTQADDIEIISIDEYDGTLTMLKKLKDKLSENIIMFKGDIITQLDASCITNNFCEEEDKFLTVMTESEKSDWLVVHNENEVFYITLTNGKTIRQKYSLLNDHPNCIFERDLVPLQLYIFKKEIIDLSLTQGHSFRDCTLPQIVEALRMTCPVKLFIPEENTISQLYSFKDYVEINNKRKFETEFIKWTVGTKEKCSEFINVARKTVSFEGLGIQRKTVVGKNFLATSLSNVHDTIIGHDVEIGENSDIRRCIIMDGAKIGENCVIENCIIGFEAVIFKNSTLKECRVPALYVIEENNTAIKKNFILKEESHTKKTESDAEAENKQKEEKKKDKESRKKKKKKEKDQVIKEENKNAEDGNLNMEIQNDKKEENGNVKSGLKEGEKKSEDEYNENEMSKKIEGMNIKSTGREVETNTFKEG